VPNRSSDSSSRASRWQAQSKINTPNGFVQIAQRIRREQLQVDLSSVRILSERFGFLLTALFIVGLKTDAFRQVSQSPRKIAMTMTELL
jgi:hypothetical protein